MPSRKEMNMKIQAEINKIYDGNSAIKAIANVKINDEFAVYGFKVMEGVHGLFVSMPSHEYKDKDGKSVYKDIFYPITDEARKKLRSAVLAAYDQKLSADLTETTDENIDINM